MNANGALFQETEESFEKEVAELQTQGRRTEAIKREIVEAKSEPLRFTDYFMSAKIKVGNTKEKSSSTIRHISSFLHRLFKREEPSGDKEEEKKADTKTESKMEDVDDVRFDTAKLNECKDLVANDFNVLLYGIGSKFQLMKKLAHEYLNEVGDVLFINGASATVTIKQILGKVIQLVYSKSPSRPKVVPSRLSDQIAWLDEKLSRLARNESTTRIILVVHCLDVIVGVDQGNREAISKLGEMQRVQFVASVDNCRCFTPWDSIALSSLHFIYINHDTYLPYMKEECYFLDQYTRHEEVKERGLAFILKSLTDRHKEVLKILAQYQLDNPKEPGLTREKLYEQANDKMLISSQKQLKDCLVEFIDHKVILEKEESDGKTHIVVQFPRDTLEKILADKL